MSKDSDNKKDIEKYYTSPPPPGPKALKFKGIRGDDFSLECNASIDLPKSSGNSLSNSKSKPKKGEK